MRPAEILSKFKVKIFISILFGIGISLLEIFSISLLYPIIEGGTNGGSGSFLLRNLSNFFSTYNKVEKLQYAAVLILISTIFKVLLTYLKTLLGIQIKLDIVKDAQEKCFKKVMDMPLGIFEGQKRGDLQTLSLIHTHSLGELTKRLISISHMPFVILVILVFTLEFSIPLTLVALISSGLLFLITSFVNKTGDRKAKLLTPAQKKLNSQTLDFFNGKKIVMAYNLTPIVVKKFNKVVADNLNAIIGMEKIRSLSAPLSQLSSVFSIFIILLSFSYLLKNNSTFQTQEILIFIAAFSRLVGPINSIIELRIALIGDIPYIKELFEFLERNTKTSEEASENLYLKEMLELSDVSFTYPTRTSPALESINVKIKKGAKIGIVGESGSGKSTLIDLLMGFHEPGTGRIFCDESSQSSLSKPTWKSLFSVVSQHTFLFDSTIRENITLGSKDPSDERVWDILSKVGLKEFTEGLPNGLDTFVGEAGVLFSGGQIQRVAIARAFYRNTDVIIFDEATSALDSKNERIVQDSIDILGDDKTIILISHRLSTLKKVDYIYVLDSGRIIEEGKISALLENPKSKFNLMYQSQWGQF